MTRLIVLSGLYVFSRLVSADAPSAVALIEGMEQTLWSDSNHGRFTMRIETQYWARELELEAWMDRPERTLVRIHAPRKEAGIGSLRIDDAMWNYLPKVDRTIKIPPSMMLQPWMGSNFSNDDLVKESSFADDYSHEVVGSTEMDGMVVYQVVSTPRPEAPVVWSRLEFQIRADYIPVAMTYYGERDTPVKEMSYTNVDTLGGRRIPTRWIMTDSDDRESRTIIEIQSIEFDVPLEGELFTLRRLRNPE